MSNVPQDAASEVRKGEGLPLEVLQAYLKEHAGIQGPLEVKQFPSGFSNLTYLVTSGAQAWVLRRPPLGANIATAHDMGREYRVLTLLQPHFQKIPKPVLFCDDESVIGVPFYLMERVEGAILRGQLPKGVQLAPDLMGKLSVQVAHALADLHDVDLDASGLMDLGKPEGYVARQVKGWTKRYFAAETDKISAMNELADWMERNQPEQERAAFIHNDFKYDNLVLNPSDLTEIKAVLDWEMATIGDPLMDLGTTLAYWAEAGDPDLLKPYNPSWLPGNLDRAAMAEQYCERRRINISQDELLFYYVFGVFKVAVIGQQIYARFKAGHSQDPRFGMLIHVVKACAENGRLALEKNKFSDLW